MVRSPGGTHILTSRSPDQDLGQDSAPAAGGAARGLESFLEGALWPRVLTAVLSVWAAGLVLTQFPMNQDVAALMDQVHRTLDGERMYFDIIEVNPPLVLYLYQLPVLLARRLHLGDGLVVHASVLLLAALSLPLSARTLAAAGLPTAMRRVLLWVLLSLSLPFALTHTAQREHLLCLLSMPFLFGVACEAAGRPRPMWLQVAAGALAAFGVALKPHFLALWCCAEAYLYIGAGRRRAFRRMETLLIGAVNLAYLTWVVFGTGYLAVARLAVDAYAAYDNSLSFVIGQGNPILLGAAAAVLLAPRGWSPERRPLRAVLAIGLGVSAYAAVIQSKGFPYHWLPAQAFSYLALAAGLLEVTAARGAGARAVAQAGLVLVSLHPYASPTRTNMGEAAIEGQKVRDIALLLRELSPGQRVAWFSTTCYPQFPSLNYAGKHQGLRAPLWLLPSIYADVPPYTAPFPYHGAADMPEQERRVLDAVTRDLQERRFDLLVVDRHGNKQGFGPTAFDFLDYFARQPRVVEQLRAYRVVRDYGPLRFLQRRDLTLQGGRDQRP